MPRPSRSCSVAFDFYKEIVDGCLAEFGEPVSYILSKENARKDIIGIFHSESLTYETDEGLYVSDQVPMLTFRLSDIPRPVHRADKVIVRSKMYEVRDSQENKDGTTKLALISVG